MRSTLTLGAMAAFGLIVAAIAAAAPKLERMDRYGPALEAYATVHRPDGTYRRMLASHDALPAMATGEPAPDGTRILMETYYRPGVVSTVFHMQKVDGRWLFGSFAADRPDLGVRERASCLGCHGAAAGTDLVFTMPSLHRAAAGGGASTFDCDRGGRRPCTARTYADAGRP